MAGAEERSKLMCCFLLPILLLPSEDGNDNSSPTQTQPEGQHSKIQAATTCYCLPSQTRERRSNPQWRENEGSWQYAAAEMWVAGHSPKRSQVFFLH